MASTASFTTRQLAGGCTALLASAESTYAWKRSRAPISGRASSFLSIERTTRNPLQVSNKSSHFSWTRGVPGLDQVYPCFTPRKVDWQEINPGLRGVGRITATHEEPLSAPKHQSRSLGRKLRRHINKRASDILHTFRKEEKLKVEYETEEEEQAALSEQRLKLASGLKKTLLRLGATFVVLAVIKILNTLREALLAQPVDYLKLLGVLGSMDYWVLAFLLFDIRNTITEIQNNGEEGEPTVRVLEQENVAIGVSFEKFFKRMFKVLSAIAFAQVLGVLSLTGIQLAPNVESGLRNLWGFVSPHL